MKNCIKHLCFPLAVSALMLADSAHAYIGPGAGLGAIGTLIAFFGAILLAIVGFVWYPIKRLLKRNKPAAKDNMVQQHQRAAADQQDQPQIENGEGEKISP